MSVRIVCRDCWRIHDAYAKCEGFSMWLTESGREEINRRKEAMYAKAAAEREHRDDGEAFHLAQKAGAPYQALAALKQGPRATLAIQEARKFNTDAEAVFLLLLGAAGVGKSLAATLVAVDFAKKWPWNEGQTGTDLEPLRYVDAVTLMRVSVFDSEAQRYVDGLKRCHLLVLEDVGDEGTELGKGLLVELLMTRHASRRRTVVTGNLVPNVFQERYGRAVWDRIKSSGYIPSLAGQTSQRTKYKRPGDPDPAHQ